MKKVMEIIHEDHESFVIEGLQISALFAWFVVLGIAAICILT